MTPFCPNCQALLTGADQASGVCSRCMAVLPKGDPGEELAEARQREAVARLRRRQGLSDLLPWRWNWVAARRSTGFRVCQWVGGFSVAIGLVVFAFHLTHHDEYAARYVEDSVATTGTVTDVRTEKQRVRKQLVARRGGAGQVLAEYDTFEEFRKVEYRFSDGRSDRSGYSRVYDDNKRQYREGDKVRIRYLPVGSGQTEIKSELDDEIGPRMDKIISRRIAWKLLLGVPVLVIVTVLACSALQERLTRRDTFSPRSTAPSGEVSPPSVETLLQHMGWPDNDFTREQAARYIAAGWKPPQ